PSLAMLVEVFGSCFTVPTLATFRVLLAGLIAQTGRRTVCGMLVGAGGAEWMPHDRAHRLLSQAAWSIDQEGLAPAPLIVDRPFPDRSVHVAADAAYHGRPLRDLPDRITWTTRLARNAVLFHLPPPRTGRRGRPRTKGERIGSPVQAATHAPWRQATVTRYGHTTTPTTTPTGAPANPGTPARPNRPSKT